MEVGSRIVFLRFPRKSESNRLVGPRCGLLASLYHHSFVLGFFQKSSCKVSSNNNGEIRTLQGAAVRSALKSFALARLASVRLALVRSLPAKSSGISAEPHLEDLPVTD